MASSLADENTAASSRRENYIGSDSFAFSGAELLRQFGRIICWFGSTSGARVRSPSTFFRSKALILFTRRLMPAELRLQSDRETQKSGIYFTNHTLTGKPNAFPFQESESGLSARVGLLVRLFFAGCLPYLFHQSHFDWEKDASPSPGLDSARRFRRPRSQ